MDHFLQLHEFFVEGGDQQKSHVLLHITEPSTPEEEEKGYFFAICEVANADNRIIVKIQSIIDEIEERYYGTPKHSNSQHLLEEVLEKINQENFSILQPGLSLNCVVGVINQPEIVFSFHGKPQILLFYKNKEGYYKPMDLVENGTGEENQQLFSQLVQGKISTSDFLFLSTPRLRDYFTPDRIQKIITTRPPHQTAEHLERVLTELRSNLSYGGIIIHLEKEPVNAIVEKKQRPTVNTGSVKSLNRLYNTEQSTANTLSPSVLNKVNKKFQDLMDKAPDWIKNLEDNSSPPSQSPTPLHPNPNPAQISSAHLHQYRGNHRTPAQKIDYRSYLFSALRVGIRILKYTGQAIIWLVILIWSVTKSLGKFLAALFYLVTNMHGKRHTVLASWQEVNHSYREHFHNLPVITKILFLGALILVVAFVGSISYITVQKKQNALEQQIANAVQAAKDKKDSAESYLIYGEEDKTINDLKEAETILASVDCARSKEQDQCSSIKTSIADLKARARKASIVQPELIYDWGTSAPTNILKIGNKILAYSHSNSILYSVDLSNKSTKTIPTNANITSFNSATAPKENDYALLLFNNKDVLKYNPEDDSVNTQDISYPGDVKIVNLVVYNRRLYTLDDKNGQIFKHDNIKSGFDQGKPWIKNSGNLQNPVSIAIDGDVFVLANNGQIRKCNAGEEQNFPPLTIDPPLVSANEIWTYADLRYIYLLDTKEKRVLALDREGQLYKQYVSNSFISPTDMAVDEPNNTVYIMDSGKLYRFGI